MTIKEKILARLNEANTGKRTHDFKPGDDVIHTYKNRTGKAKVTTLSTNPFKINHVYIKHENGKIEFVPHKELTKV